MAVRLTLLLAASAGVIAASGLADWSGLILLAGLAALAGLLRLLRAALRRPEPADRPSLGLMIVDGSNVMYWKDETPRIETVREVVRHLADLGYTPGVVFDANAGYLLSGRYRHHRHMGRMLGIRADRVMVVPKGTPADPYILNAARRLGARIVTNDRYRDWAEDHPEIRHRRHLVRGGYRSGRLWLDLKEEKDHPASAARPA
jgi:hypothetical protein